jgi:hypothetical protein
MYEYCMMCQYVMETCTYAFAKRLKQVMEVRGTLPTRGSLAWRLYSRSARGFDCPASSVHVQRPIPSIQYPVTCAHFSS